ncbi:DUF1772 domain-containing protein, partial [Mesorhizobium sp. M00.F.Ca.ET.217.01.1.1]|uniref:anthrone oxygenase family protein n=1 Tax=Mesorhizobium sp. M00.F.Ca.ET.217.01.1.1 TaxID=2500529 RepID=UPI001093099A
DHGAGNKPVRTRLAPAKENGGNEHETDETGAVIYLIGNPIVTMVFNVPLNDALAAVDPASANGAAVWANYLNAWVMWNHVRTVTAIVAMACFIMALI